ncbi:MAG: RNA 2',3'-cyclic phosphodiesterase [Bacteroidales bacterium]|nr:RNA 2',3'-cyclic phosphodiesterase [Bacteroidales bacterium]
MENMRLFVAIKIDPEEQFRNTYGFLRQALDFNIIKWVELENIHLTLKFIGDTSPEEVPQIIEALSGVCEGIEPFRLEIANTGVFGSNYNPKVIWFGITPNKMLQNLAQNVSSKLETVGILGDRQNFVPHLTIGRIREIKDKKYFQQLMGRFNEVEIQSQTVTGFTLYESILKREGPQYNELGAYLF